MLMPHDFAVSESDLPNFHKVTPHIFRGGQPSNTGFAWLKQMDVRTILNLRDERLLVRSEELTVGELGFRYVNIALSPFVEPSAEQIESCLDVLRQAKETPVFVHCLHGMDRTGVIVGSYRMVVEGWTLASAFDEMVELGFHSQFANLTMAIQGVASRLAEANCSQQSTRP